MIRLEDLKVDSTLEGLSAGGPARVIRVDSLGPDSRKIFFEDRDANLHQQVLYRSNEESLRPAAGERGARWPFSADPERFKLGVEAHRIRLAYLFDPMMAVHAANVEPLPHQISAVYEHMLPKTPLRFVLADDPGAGKTIMAGLLISELILRADADRILIVAPGSLVVQWQEELNPPYSPSLLLRHRQAPHLRRFARSRILTGQASTPPVRSVAKHPICRA